MNNLEINICPETFNNIVTSVAKNIRTQDIAKCIDLDDLASYIDQEHLDIRASDVAENIDTQDIAGCIDICEVASYLNIDEITEEVLRTIDYKKLASALLATLLEDKPGLTI